MNSLVGARTAPIACRRGFYISQALELIAPVSVIGTKFARTWTHIGTRFLPFADAATPELPLGRLLRLSLFQVSVGLGRGAADRHA